MEEGNYCEKINICFDLLSPPVNTQKYHPNNVAVNKTRNLTIGILSVSNQE